MRIIFVTNQLKNGGAEREIAAFASTFARMGQEVHLFCIYDPTSDYVMDPGVHLHRLTFTSRINIPKVRFLFRRWNAIRQLQSLHADIILPVTVSFQYYPMLWLAAKFSGAKLLYAVRTNLERLYPGKKDRKGWKRAAWLADGIWLQTDGQRCYFPASYEKKIFVVPNMLEPGFLQLERRERTVIRRFISVGRFHPLKNQKLMVEAFAQMLEQTKDQSATLTIYGQSMPWDGSVEKELRELIRKYRLEERILLPGRKKEVEKCYKEGDAFVLSSDYEGLPNALMEAMAAGLPCISTDCPTGPSTLITSGENGLLVPVGDVKMMAQAMEYYMKHPQFASRMGAAARKRMQSWESCEQMAERMLENFRKICG